MNTAFVSVTSNNSLFAVLRNINLRFTLHDRIIQRSAALQKPFGLAVNLYYVIKDAMSYGQLWAELGYSYDSIIKCRQAIHALGEDTTVRRPQVVGTLREFVSFLNKQMAIITLLLNDPKVNTLTLNLVVSKPVQDKLQEILTKCTTTPKIRGAYGYATIPGVNHPVLRKGVTIMSDQDMIDIAMYLRKPENGALLTEVYTAYIGELSNNNLRCVNTKALIQAFLEENQVVSDVFASIYLNNMEITYLREI